MKELYNYKFRPCMLGAYQGDVLALSGNSDGEFKYLSSPVSFDQVNEVVQTASGSVYKLINNDGDKEETFQEIERVIQRGGYRRC